MNGQDCVDLTSGSDEVRIINSTTTVEANKWLGLLAHPLFKLDESETIYYPSYEKL
jgi:hypothetical protein